MQVGAHVSMSGSKVLSDDKTSPHGNVTNVVFRQVAPGGSCGQIFTTLPQMWCDPDISDEEAELLRKQTADKLSGPWVIHSSYLINLCTPKDDLRQKSLDSMQAEVDMTDKLGIEYVNVHLGTHTGVGEQQGLDNAVSILDDLDISDGVTVLTESDAGSSTKMGDDLAHLDYVLEESDQDLDVCLDTAHVFAAGYDLSTVEGVDETLAELDAEVGLEHLKCVHLNDSKYECGMNKNEHALIGEGFIGEEGIRAFINHDVIVDDDVPLILETPIEDDKGFAWNIERVRELRAD